MQYVVMRVLYPRLWTDATNFESIAREELSGTAWRLWFIELTAYVIPFVASMLFGLLFHEQGVIPLSSLMCALAILGMVGTGIVRIATGAMAKNLCRAYRPQLTECREAAGYRCRTCTPSAILSLGLTTTMSPASRPPSTSASRPF